MLRRRSPVLLVAVCVVLVFSRASLAAPATATGGSGQLLDLVNAERAAAGLSALEWRDDVAAIATGWSAHMASNGELAHNDAYFSDATRTAIGSESRGENVATSGSIEGAHQALMNSPPHRASILSGEFTQAGFGAVQDVGGRWWVTQNFLRPSDAGVVERVAEPQPEPEPEPEPDLSVDVSEAAPQPRAMEPTAEPEPVIVAASAPPSPTTAPTTVPSAAAVAIPATPQVAPTPVQPPGDAPTDDLAVSESQPLPPLVVVLAGALIALGLAGHARTHSAKTKRHRPVFTA